MRCATRQGGRRRHAAAAAAAGQRGRSAWRCCSACVSASVASALRGADARWLAAGRYSGADRWRQRGRHRQACGRFARSHELRRRQPLRRWVSYGSAWSIGPVGSAGFGGPRILVTPEVADALGRLQHGETGFDFARRAVSDSAACSRTCTMSLRDLQESPIGAQRQPARGDDHRAGRDAVRFHLRDHGSAGQHQGAGRHACRSRC